MDLNALRDFLAVVAHQGFAPAARARGIPKSTLSRRVRELEDALGVRLVDRTSRKVRATVDGAELYERGARALAEVDEVEQMLLSRDATPKGKLRISAPMIFGQLFLGNFAAMYAARYPEVELSIVLGGRTVDVVGEGFDAAIFANAPDTTELVQRRFAVDHLLLVAPHALAAQARRAGSRPLELPAILYETALVAGESAILASPWRITEGKRKLEVRPRPVMRLSSMFMIRDAVLAGAGAALLPQAMVGEAVASGQLARVGYLDRGDVTLSIVHPSRRLVSRRLRAFIDLLVTTFAHGVFVGRL